VIGDVSALHDIGSLHSLANDATVLKQTSGKKSHPLTTIVVNNNGAFTIPDYKQSVITTFIISRFDLSSIIIRSFRIGRVLMFFIAIFIIFRWWHFLFFACGQVWKGRFF
jgi:hypothetical protein